MLRLAKAMLEAAYPALGGASIHPILQSCSPVAPQAAPNEHAAHASCSPTGPQETASDVHAALPLHSLSPSDTVTSTEQQHAGAPPNSLAAFRQQQCADSPSLNLEIPVQQQHADTSPFSLAAFRQQQHTDASSRAPSTQQQPTDALSPSLTPYKQQHARAPPFNLAKALHQQDAALREGLLALVPASIGCGGTWAGQDSNEGACAFDYVCSSF